MRYKSKKLRGYMMRLLNVQTLTLEKFDCPPFPPYAILSHTWGQEEITFQDTHDLQKASVKAGFTKFKLTCQMTAAQQLQYVWIDTCCIDKSSGTELSEAINTMYQWYQSSSKCLVYLEDLPSFTALGALDECLENCRWFSRGWTLQELIAPRTVVFYNQAWDIIGEKKSTALLSRISNATGIHQDILLNPDLIHTTSVAVRMSWAADRATSRQEDIAYCLLGLFKVSMPLLYGEGDGAFRRLQEEIIRTSNDLSIFAWYDEDNLHGYHGILAGSPRVFRNFQSKMLGNKPFNSEKEYRITNEGLHITARLLRYPSGSTLFMSLREDKNDGYQVGIMLQNISGVHIRIHAHRLFKVGLSFWDDDFETIIAWIGPDFSTVFWIHRHPQSLPANSKTLPSATYDTMYVDNDRSSADVVSWGSLCSYCIVGAPSNTWKMRPSHSAQPQCVSGVQSCKMYDPGETHGQAGFGRLKRRDIPRLYGTTANQYVSLSQDIDGPTSLDEAGNSLDSLGGNHHQDSQPNPFASFRGEIFDMASKCFEVYMPCRLSELSNEYGFISQGASSFACPFMKMNTYKYRSCLRKPRIRTNHDLMEHLNSIHRQPLHCPVCTLLFQDIWTRNNHIRDRSCVKAQLVLPPGISIEQMNELRILLGGSSMKPLNDEDWYKVWDALFLERARPESPLIDKEIEITMSALQSFWMDHGSNLIAEFLASRGQLKWRIPNEERGLANLHSAVLFDLMGRYLFASSN
ncbi:heterokaryon incompatibility protein-domain-containing protein [Xylaria acuta]|nr:heterokaryon incompatibility protein-domain-containing protein [Xylaria acuta]